MSLDLKRQLVAQLVESSRLLRNYIDHRAKGRGTTRAQWIVLFRLRQQEGLSQVDLADVLELQPISLVRLLDRLVEHGLLERRPDPRDRRANRLVPDRDAAVSSSTISTACATPSRRMSCRMFLRLRSRPVSRRCWTSRSASRELAEAGRHRRPSSRSDSIGRRCMRVAGATDTRISKCNVRSRCHRMDVVPYHRRCNASRRSKRANQEAMMDELNGRMIACQILITGLIARVANNSPDPLRFLTDFRDEIKARGERRSISPAWKTPIGCGRSRSKPSMSCFR